jgi:predicted membrane channel-forming protein YqfA (hemolysin III family)
MSIAQAANTRAEEFPTAVGYSMGYLGAVAALPLLAHELTWRELPLTIGFMLACILGMRIYQHYVISGVLSPRRAKDVMRSVDMASLFLLMCSLFVTLSLDARGVEHGWTLFAVLALAALVCSLIMLRQAHVTWFSLTLLSRQDP